jgi:hypothetical protein
MSRIPLAAITISAKRPVRNSIIITSERHLRLRAFYEHLLREQSFAT